ncbi:tumor necrosis factor ligand superfamily member 9 [Pelodiscus sinensis]|uniref:tumor necrosis factor ligand superfamily member 9 n=1 Tax=Pelodiscus sinensis TaxID=13735 RepID=UPI003F6CFC94
MTAVERSQDPESLLPAGSRRACPCRSLDWCLLAALCALGAALAGFACFSVWGGLASPPGAPPAPHALLGAREETGAQLLPKNVAITNSRMEWHYSPGVDRVVFSSNFQYHHDSHTLEVKVGGLYFIYAQLAVRCTERMCDKHQNVTLTVRKMSDSSRPILTLSLDLSSKSEDTMSKFLAVLRPLNQGDQLFVQMQIFRPDDAWQLDEITNKNFFGLFKLPTSAEPATQ